jgi:hypothetical protein
LNPSFFPPACTSSEGGEDGKVGATARCASSSSASHEKSAARFPAVATVSSKFAGVSTTGVRGRCGGEELRVLDRVLELQRGAAERLHRVSRLAESTRDGLGAASRVHRGVDERRETRGRELDARRAEPRPELARQRGALGDGGQGVARRHGRRDERGDEEEREEGLEGDAAGRSTLRHDGRRRVRGSRGRLLRRRSEPGGGGET